MKIFRNKIPINVIIIISILSHVTLLHTFAKDLVVCLNDNGNVKIEKINDCEECTTSLEVLLNSGFNKKSISDIDCEDIPLDEFCFEENQLLPKADVLFWKLFVTAIVPNINEYTAVNYIVISGESSYNFILQNYTSVSLLI